MCILSEKQILSGKFGCRLLWLKPALVIINDQNRTLHCKYGDPTTSRSSEIVLLVFFHVCPVLTPEDSS